MARGDGYSIIKRRRKGREIGPYQIRVQVPAELQSVVGKKEVLRSLKTEDRRIAQARAAAAFTELRSQWWDSARGAGALSPAARVPTDEELEEIAVVLGYDLPSESANAARLSLRGKSSTFYRAHVNYVQSELEGQIQATATGDHDAVRHLADEAIEAMGYDLPRDSEGYAKLCELLSKARLVEFREQHRRNLGDLDSGHRSELVGRVRERQAAKAEPGETLLELFEKWATERLDKDKKRPDTVTQDRKRLEQFASYIGPDRAIDSITPKDIAAYRDLLRDLPPKWDTRAALKGLSIRDAASRARELGLPRLAYTTINQHLSTISPVYTWLAEQPAWAGLANPCTGLFHKDVKGHNPRPPLSTSALNKMLKSPLFTGFLADGKEHMPGNMLSDDWRKWILLGCLFTGARIGEIAQLRTGDVHEQRGVWLVRIREDKEAGLQVKNRKEHVVPLHSKLIELGFVDFVKRQQDERGDDAPLFVGIERDERGQFAKVSRWYRKFFERIGIKDGRDGVGAHSFRHTLTDRLREEAELLDREIGVLLNHSARSTTSGYGALPQGTVTMMQGWLEAVTWEGVSFDHLMPEAA